MPIINNNRNMSYNSKKSLTMIFRNRLIIKSVNNLKKNNNIKKIHHQNQLKINLIKINFKIKFINNNKITH